MADTLLRNETEVTAPNRASWVYLAHDQGGGVYADRKVSINNLFGAAADVVIPIARAHVWGASDIAFFSHEDHSSTSNAGFRQTAAGATMLNAASGQAVTLGIGGTAAVWLTSGSLLSVGSASPVAGSRFYSHALATDTYAGYFAGDNKTTLQDGSSGNTGTDEQFDNLWEAVKITAGFTSSSVSGFSVRLKRTGTITNPTATITGYIYSDSGGQPNAIVGSLSSIRLGTLTTSYVEYHFGGTSGLTINSATDYWLVLSQSSAPTGGTVQLDRGTSGANAHAFSANGSSWTLEASKTCWHKVYSITGYGAYGASYASYGGRFESINFYGVRGGSQNLYGVWGTSANSTGVYGQSSNYIGVQGVSTEYVGVSGVSTNNVGTQGTSATHFGVYGLSTSSRGVTGVSTSSYGGYFQTLTGIGLLGIQVGTLTGSITSNALWAYRNLTLGGFDATGAVLMVEDNTAATGPLQDWRKQSTTLARMTGAGILVLGSTVLNGTARMQVYGDIAQNGANGGQSTRFVLTELVNIQAAAETDSTIQIPANSYGIELSYRVVNEIPDTDTMDVGIVGALDRFGDDIVTDAGITHIAVDQANFYTSAAAIRFTPNLVPSGSAGDVRLVIRGFKVTAPTS